MQVDTASNSGFIDAILDFARSEIQRKSVERDVKSDDEEGATEGGSGGSVIARLGKALGQAQDAQAEKIIEKANEVAELTKAAESKVDSDTGKTTDGGETKASLFLATQEVAALSNELNALSTSGQSAVSAVGQAANTAGRRA